MIKATIYYSDGSVSIKYFSSIKEAMWFINTDGDHVKDYTLEETGLDSTP